MLYPLCSTHYALPVSGKLEAERASKAGAGEVAAMIAAAEKMPDLLEPHKADG